MVRRIILILIAFILLALVVLWVVGGGPRNLIQGTRDAVTTVSAIGTTEKTSFRLPWQPVQIFPTFDITELLNFDPEKGVEYEGDFVYLEEHADLEAEYDRLSAETDDRHLIGTPSPYSGKVSIVKLPSGPKESDVNEERIELLANFGNSEEIDITGWMIESALAGTRVVLPPGVSTFSANRPNSLEKIVLAAGMRALVTSGPSPIGISFHENMCSGYLAQRHYFSPDLEMQCPSPRTVVPFSTSNLQKYGESCFDELEKVKTCEYPEALPTTLTSVCRTHLQDVLSYSGCVRDNHFRSAFFSDTWRVYLGANTELWRNSHDAIRLLDASGKTVSVYIY